MDHDPIETHNRQGQFLTTRLDDLSVIRSGGDLAQEAIARFCRTYWMPVYCFVRKSGHSPEDAADITQSFLGRILEREDLKSFVPEKGRFRSWLLACLQRFMIDQWRSAHGVERRPDGGWLSLDAEEAETGYLNELLDSESPDRAFDRQWALVFFDGVLRQLERECRAEGNLELFEHLVAHLGGKSHTVSHEEAAHRMGKSVGSLKNELTVQRKRFANAAMSRLYRIFGNRQAAVDELKYLISVASDS